MRSSRTRCGTFRIGLLSQQIDLPRGVRNMLAHFVVRRIPEEDAFVFLTKSSSDFKQVFGEMSPPENMLFGVTDAAEIYGIEPVLKGLLSWLSKLPAI